MSEDFTQTMRDIDALQERLDNVFKRVNADPVYETASAIADAISDNPRYFSDDRKKEYAEIFFAILDQVYDRIVKQDKTNPCCNPMIPAGTAARIPEADMFMRDLMPLSWALEAQWLAPALAGTIDTFFKTFTQEEAELIRDLLQFLAQYFPEAVHADVQAYWTKIAEDRESLRDESDEDKAFMLSVLVRKKAEMEQKKQQNKQ